jgi:AbrB family looped-hinge helix DNA binding protein
MLKSTISSKGQITVPAEIRERLGLDAGTVVLFDLQARGVLVRKGAVGQHPVEKVFGILKPRQAVDSLALLDEMRGPRPGGARAKAARGKAQ